MPRPVEEVVAILRDLLDAAERGTVTDVFVVYREKTGEYGSAFWTFDLDDLLVQIGTETIYIRGRVERPDDSRH
ncbi:hypothetical protein [Lysobacter sp. HA35]